MPNSCSARGGWPPARKAARATLPASPPPRAPAALRNCDCWIPALSLVAEAEGGDIIGHELSSWGRIGPVRVPNLSLLGVHPGHRRRGVGSALVHASLAAADALEAPMVVVLGDPDYYGRFGFRRSTDFGVVGQELAWEHMFRIRTLAAYDPVVQGEFIHPDPFDHV
ncbi:GNAT family N-acetyltransferase [Embleya sp. NPDC050493]|uniref:GNAT family N-acetyltransferase n=1 Tax=Embleya sp. NPDC050493 TaxID=3363989 RepID=UPI0037B1B93C